MMPQSSNRINFILLMLLIVCALSVVTSQNRARKYFAQLQTEQDAERKLDQEWRELQIESQTQSTGKRIEQKAITQLGMVLPDAKKTIIVVLDNAGAAK
jgi:cell division protein FtsL